jgi:hypothetical protein
MPDMLIGGWKGVYAGCSGTSRGERHLEVKYELATSLWLPAETL